MPAASIPFADPPARVSASAPGSSFATRKPRLRDRAGGLMFAAAMIVLTFLVMLRMGGITLGEERKPPALVAINLPKPPPPEAASGSAPKKATAKIVAVEPQQPRVLPPPIIKPKVTTPALVNVSHADMAAWDISKLKSGSGGGAGGAGSGKLYGPGEAPGVGKLYNAQWFREPTHAELATYLPQGAPASSWGMIACRTIENYHVENCQELDESPPGSGLARALRRASWQFLVRPPRIDGKPLIGSWVRIRFTFTAPKSVEEQAEEVPGE